MKISLYEVAERIRNAQRIVVTAHINPDGDAVGSTLGMTHFLRAAGKSVQALIDDDIPGNFRVLPGYEMIEKPSEEITADLLLVLDTAPDRIGRVTEYVKAPMINVDHHRTNDGTTLPTGDFYVDSARAATAEIVYELIDLTGAIPNYETATALYTGLATDTGFFRFSNVTSYTLRAAAALVDCGVRPNIISEAMEEKTYESIRSMATALQTIERFADGKAAGICLDYPKMSEIDSTEGFIDMVRVIEGVDVAFLLKETEKDLCRISMRSKSVDVSKIAQSFGGGGHSRAAGATLTSSFEEAKKNVIQAILHELTE